MGVASLSFWREATARMEERLLPGGGALHGLEAPASRDYILPLRVFSPLQGAVPRVTWGKQPKEVSADWAALPEPWAG